MQRFRFLPSSSFSSLFFFSQNSISSTKRFCSNNNNTNFSSEQQEQEEEPKLKIGQNSFLNVEFDTLGTGRFVAYGNAKPPFHDHVSIVLTCDVSDRMLGLKEFWDSSGRNKNALILTSSSSQENSNDNSKKSSSSSSFNLSSSWKKKRQKYSFLRPMGIEDEESRIPSPVSFNIFLEIGLEAISSQSSSTTSACAVIVASCVGESSLSIDGISFPKSFREALDRSPASLQMRRDLYQGPLLHQGNLAEAICNTNFTPSPIALPRQHQELSLRPNFGAKFSPFARFGHLPVHTVQSSMYDAIFSWCESLGVNDRLARDVRSVALRTQEKELKNWNEEIKTLTKRKIFK